VDIFDSLTATGVAWDPAGDADRDQQMRSLSTRRADGLEEKLSRLTVRPMRATASGNRRPAGRRRLTPAGPPSLAVVALNRLGFGPRVGDLEAFTAGGATDAGRLEAWLDAQLSPQSIEDTELEAKIAAAGFTTLEKSADELWADHILAEPEHKERVRPLDETARAAFLRAIYSRRQLLEVLTDFWHNHFNVYAWDYYTAPVWVAYDRDVIRGNAMGNFRKMLGEVAASWPMLYYLDNYLSSRAGPNENYARELFELHAMGAENYLGVVPQDEVARDAEDRPVGYVDGDVYEATRCFTGWTFDYDNGVFTHRDDWHDRFQKRVLAHSLAPDQPPLRDGQDVLDLLADHPGTARFISRKLCRRLIGDDPPESVVESAAAVFFAHRDATDQLKRVVETIVLSQEFSETWGEKVKRPFELVVSAMRAVDADLSFALDDKRTDSFLWLFERTGHLPFAWRAPDGYSDFKKDWLSTSPLTMSWRLLNWLVDQDHEDGSPVVDVVSETPESVTNPIELADFWIQRILGRSMTPADRQEVIDMMAQGRNPELAVPYRSDESARDRLRTMVALIMLSPDFLWR